MRTLLAAALLIAGVSFAADELTPQNMAKIQSEQKKASEAIDKKYGNKKPSELTPDERRAMQKEKGESERAVLDKHGVDPKSFAKAGAKMGREDRAANEAATQDLERQDAQAKTAPAADSKKGGKKEIVIEKDGKSSEPVNEAAEMDKAAGLGRGKK